MKWVRVTRASKCGICGKPDWCCFLPERQLANCMRVQSDWICKNGGWIHKLGKEILRPEFNRKPEPRISALDCASIMGGLRRDTSMLDYEEFANSIGVNPEALVELGCARDESKHAWAIPMHDGSGNMIGVRMRGDDGRKWCIPGSRNGVFLPSKKPISMAFLVEGATDTAAILSLGLWGFGRPQCSGCVQTILATINRLHIRRLVVVPDNDKPGLDGAFRFEQELHIPHVTYLPPSKDLRESVRAGLTKELLESTLKQMIWTHPQRQAA